MTQYSGLVALEPVMHPWPCFASAILHENSRVAMTHIIGNGELHIHSLIGIESLDVCALRILCEYMQVE